MRTQLFMGNTIDLHGVKLSMKNPRVKKRFSHLRLRIRKNWEENEIAFVMKYVPKNQNFIDLGGCTGYISLKAKKFKNTKKHIVVEGNPEMADVIKENIRLNNLKGIEVINKVYSNNKKGVIFTISNEGIGNSSVFKKEGRKIVLKPISLKEIVRKYKIKNFNLMCDLEGSEEELINEEMDVLRNHCNVIVIDFEPNTFHMKGKILKNGFEIIEERKLQVAFKNKSIE